MYIHDVEKLRSLISERKFRRKDIKSKINVWVEREYGIDDFAGRAEKYFSCYTSQEKSVGVLARQTPSICTEDCAILIAAKSIGVAPLAVGFDRDTHSNANLEKVNRIKIPLTTWSRKGNLMVEYDQITKTPLNTLEMKVLARIETRSHQSLPSHHNTLRDEVFGHKDVVNQIGLYPRFDISNFWSECLVTARKKPEFVYRETTDGVLAGYAYRYSGSFTREDSESIRPPASWYYPLYFSLFLDGSMILLETYENPEGEVFEAKKLFEQTMQLIEHQTGFYPLVLEVPHLSRDMMYCNRKIMADPWQLCTIINGKPQPSEPIVSYIRNIANKVIAIR